MTQDTIDTVPDETQEGYYAHTRSELFRFIPSSTRTLLDVGCASGIFGAALMRRRPGLKIWGIEPVAAAAEAARPLLEHVIVKGVEDAMPMLPDGHFDCITFNDSLEHFADPWLVLTAMRRKLSANGRIVASIPNLRFFPVMKDLILRADFRYADEGVLDRTHLRFFTQSGMRSLFVRSGYEVHEVVGIRSHGLPFWFSQFSKVFGRRFHDMQFMQYILVATPAHAVHAVPTGNAEAPQAASEFVG